MRHFLSVDQLTVGEIYDLLETATQYQKVNHSIKQQLFVANLFFEPSTRTKMSFVLAQKRLGLDVLDFHTESSSIKKGETLYDTIKTMEAIGTNLLVIRHHEDNWINEIEDNVSIPIINAGAGKAEHPTQCLLDLLTIYQEFGTFKDINVVIVGDIKHSRVARSNAYALRRLGANVYLSAAPDFKDLSLDFPYITIDEAVEMCDAMMLLRIQHERHEQHTDSAFNYLEKYGLTKDRESKMKKHAVILHPAPVNRGVEIDSDLVECGRSRIFKQMGNGVYARMAIMTKLLQEWGIVRENTAKRYKKIIAYKPTGSM